LSGKSDDPSRKLTPAETVKALNDISQGLESVARIAAKNINDIGRGLQQVGRVMGQSYGTALHKMAEELGKTMAQYEETFDTGQDHFVLSTTWYIEADSNATPTRGTAGPVRICIFDTGYPACVLCKAVFCSHINRIYDNPDSDAEFMNEVLTSNHVDTGSYLKILLDKDTWVDAKFLNLRESLGQDSDEFMVYLPGSFGTNTFGDVPIGSITKNLEGFTSVRLLVINHLQGTIIGSAECKSSSHWKTKKSKKITTVQDAVAWVAEKKCAACVQTSKDIKTDGEDLVPKREPNWSARSAGALASGYTGFPDDHIARISARSIFVPEHKTLKLNDLSS